MTEESQLKEDQPQEAGKEEEVTFKPFQIDPADIPMIEEQARDAQSAAEPVGTKVGDNVPGAKDWGAEHMKVSTSTGAGWVWVYDTVTREPSKINRNWLAKQLAKKRPDGSFYFTTVRPKQGPRRGTIKCMLHPDAPNRDHYDEMGFSTCPKHNLPNKHQQMQHMKNKHSQEWITIKEETEDNKEAQRQHENEQFQKAILKIAEGNTKKSK